MWLLNLSTDFGAVMNLYQKMHFVGLNPTTDRKNEMHLKKLKIFRVENRNKMPEKSYDISGFFTLKCSCSHCKQQRSRLA